MTPAAGIEALALRLAEVPVRRAVPLATLGRWRIGGPADLVIEPIDEAQLARTLAAINDSAVPHVVIGDGSNLLFDDRGYRGAVVRIGRSLGAVEIAADGMVAAGAGAWVPCFVRRLLKAGLGGAEHAIGIPGTLGGLVAMNGGSRRRGIGEALVSARVLDHAGRARTLDAAALGFGYRRSALQTSGQVLVEATFRFARGDPRELAAQARAILAERRAKFPRNRRNCGSVFVSDPTLYATLGPPGQAIERCGLKGLVRGDAEISREHANFIVNRGQASSADVLALIAEAQARVAEASGIVMRPEIRYLALDGALGPPTADRGQST